MIRVDLLLIVTLHDNLYVSVCRSSLNVNQSLQFAFIRHEISDSISYNTNKFANCRKDSSWDLLWSLDMQISRPQLDNLQSQTLVDECNVNTIGQRIETNVNER